LVQALGYQAIKSGYLVYYRSVFDVVWDQHANRRRFRYDGGRQWAGERAVYVGQADGFPARHGGV
jgi:hypothetical protein